MGLLLMGVQLENLDGLTIDGHTIRKLGWAYYRIIFCRLTFGSNFFFLIFLCLLLALKIFQGITISICNH